MIERLNRDKRLLFVYSAKRYVLRFISRFNDYRATLQIFFFKHART